MPKLFSSCQHATFPPFWQGCYCILPKKKKNLYFREQMIFVVLAFYGLISKVQYLFFV